MLGLKYSDLGHTIALWTLYVSPLQDITRSEYSEVLKRLSQEDFVSKPAAVRVVGDAHSDTALFKSSSGDISGGETDQKPKLEDGVIC
jgi:hypothetical protein